MSISLQGKLRVKRLNGSNGPFCVGDLETEIGEFRVKDAVLDQFDEGTYTGQFWIQQIFPWSYTSYGRMVVEVRAKLADLQIDGQERMSKADKEAREPRDPDPAFENSATPSAPATPDAKRSRATPVKQAPAESPPNADDEASVGGVDEADYQLFGAELYPFVQARDPVKLDPTIDRLQFRLQRQRLKEELDYEFKSATQTWLPPGHPDRLKP